MPPEAENNAQSQELENTMAMLASRAPAHAGRELQLTGPQRAAVLMLALGEEYGGKIWGLLDDEELRILTQTMSSLGVVEASAVEALLLEFVSRLSASGALMGNYDATERLLQKYLPPDRVSSVMEEVRGPAGWSSTPASRSFRTRCSASAAWISALSRVRTTTSRISSCRPRSTGRGSPGATAPRPTGHSFRACSIGSRRR